MAENLDHAPQPTFQLLILVDELEPDKSSRMNTKDIILESAKCLKYLNFTLDLFIMELDPFNFFM